MFNKEELKFIKHVSPKKKPTSQRDRNAILNDTKDVLYLSKFVK